jgi:hypothetical protein
MNQSRLMDYKNLINASIAHVKESIAFDRFCGYDAPMYLGDRF